MARFFIDRPIFAWVIAILIMLVGILAIRSLPVSQYPQIAPPAVSINAVYPGASAETLANTVTQVIEQQMTGLDGLRLHLVQRHLGRSHPDHADLRDRHQPRHRAGAGAEQAGAGDAAAARRRCSSRASRSTKSSAGFLMVIGMISPERRVRAGRPRRLSRLQHGGPSSAASRASAASRCSAAQYAMRIWLDPDKLAAYQLTPST